MRRAAVIENGETGFIQTLESPGIKMLRFSGLESPGIWSLQVVESPGKQFLLSVGTLVKCLQTLMSPMALSSSVSWPRCCSPLTPNPLTS